MHQYEMLLAKPWVSVIIACTHHSRNSASPTRWIQELTRAVDGAIAQQYPLTVAPVTEILLIDDGSRADIGLDLRKIAQQYPGVRIIQQQHSGLAEAHNIGLRESRGDYLVFLSPHEQLLPFALQMGLCSLDSMPTCGFAVGMVTPSSSVISHYTQELADQSIGRSVYIALLSGRYCDTLARFIFRRSTLESMGGFDPTSPAPIYDLLLNMTATVAGCRHNQLVVESSPIDALSMAQAAEQLDNHLKVLHQQTARIHPTPCHQLAHAQGKVYWYNRYASVLRRQWRKEVSLRAIAQSVAILYTLVRHHPKMVGLLPGQSPHGLWRRFKPTSQPPTLQLAVLGKISSSPVAPSSRRPG